MTMQETKLVMVDILKKRVLNLAGVTNQELPMASTHGHLGITIQSLWPALPHGKFQHLEENLLKPYDI